MVPFYNLFCELTGINGKTGTLTAEQAGNLVPDSNRTVVVEFDTNVNSELPWGFRGEALKAHVHPGDVNHAVFVVENKSDKPVTGQAVPSVAPGQASLYFKKTECFCFTQQTLAPGERREMQVRYVVEPELPASISTLTLSYTFFRSVETQQAVGQESSAVADGKPEI
jgi:cytochrome c oxidase assembly protein subunit 11